MVLNQEKYIENQKMNKQELNKNIKIINTRKYKDINLYLRFSIEYKPLLKEKVALLTRLIGDISDKYKTKQEMTKAKDMLYGMSLNVAYKVRANIISLSLHYSFINPKFLNTDINDYVSFIFETLNNSTINETTLDEAKRNLKAAILRKKDKPTNIANESFISIIRKDNPNFEIYAEDEQYIKNIEAIQLDDLIKTYKYIVNKAMLNVYLCGDLRSKDIKQLTKFNFDNRKIVKIKTNKCTYPEHKMSVQKMEISQSYLSVTYATPFNKKHKDYFAWFLGNAFLGVLPTSLLFSEVREKMSLCYSISSIDYKNEGLVRIVTSIDGSNRNKVIKQVEKQITRLINMDYDITKLEATKTLLCNSIYGIYDDLESLVNYYYESMLSDFNYSIEQYCNKIMQVSEKDICGIYKKYKHYFNYILLGTKDE